MATPTPPPPWDPARVAARSQQLHEQFTREAAALRRKYAQPLFGEIQTWSLFEIEKHLPPTIVF